MNEKALLRKEDWLIVVMDIIKKHPDWMADTVLAINRGVMDRLEIEQSQRSSAEIELSKLVDSIKDAPSSAKIALINSGMFHGTDYAKTLEETI